MMKAIPTLSFLHQEMGATTAATRVFREKPVVSWTLARLGQAVAERPVIVCWEDQKTSIESAVNGSATIVAHPRARIMTLESITAARRWADGWRGGLFGATCFDLGFHGSFVHQAVSGQGGSAALLIDADAALVDPALIQSVIEQAKANPQSGYWFTPAAPGLGGAMVSMDLLEKLASCNGHLGRLLSYWPDLPGGDPISKPSCAPTPAPAARTLRRFTLDSDRQVRLAERATASLNGTLMRADAQVLVERFHSVAAVDEMPREVVLEVNTERATRPIYSPVSQMSFDRGAMTLELVKIIFKQLEGSGDLRLTLGGVGDPLLHPEIISIVKLAAAAGIRAIHLETDLLGVAGEVLDELVELPLDILSVYLPATSRRVYQQMMGVDEMGEVLKNLSRVLRRRDELKLGTPIVVPTFVKTKVNLGEMEGFYDHWQRAVGCAVIAGPSNCAGQIEDVSVGDMSPPKRVGCRRIQSRMVVLSDGVVVACEEDVRGRNVVGDLKREVVSEVWERGMGKLRVVHERGEWMSNGLCGGCKAWHRP